MELKGRKKNSAKHPPAAMAETALFTPHEEQVYQAVKRDPRAARNLEYFVGKGASERGLIIQLAMWAHAGDKHPAMARLREDLIVPRDRLLIFLRERGDRGATHTELCKVSPRYVTHMRELCRMGCEFRRSGRDADSRTALVRERGRGKRQLVTMEEAYRKVARGIEELGQPAPLLPAWSHALRLARVDQRYAAYLKGSPLGNFRRYLEDRFLDGFGSHLHRWTYLMAVSEKAAKGLSIEVPLLARQLFVPLRKRLQRLREK